MIRVEQLHHRYPRAECEALCGVDLHVRDGSLFGLLGPNGAGKTTLLSLLTGVLRLQQAGKVEIAGVSLRDQLPKVQAQCALVPQDHAFYPTLSARENLAFFGGVRGLRGASLRERVDACLALGALESVADRPARSYSGGLKRRLNLAIGLLNRPRLLFLDEPTVGIDLQSRAFILDSIRQLNREGMTVVYTSHYMEEVEQLCDEIAIIDGGAVLLQDRLDALLQRSRSGDLVVELDAAICPETLERVAVENDRVRSVRTEAGCELHVAFDGDAEALAALFATLSDMQAHVRRIHYGRKSLNALFLELTRRSLRD